LKDWHERKLALEIREMAAEEISSASNRDPFLFAISPINSVGIWFFAGRL
jgi:hypothetical protein